MLAGAVVEVRHLGRGLHFADVSPASPGPGDPAPVQVAFELDSFDPLPPATTSHRTATL